MFLWPQVQYCVCVWETVFVYLFATAQPVVGVFSAYLQYSQDTLSLAIPATERTHTNTHANTKRQKAHSDGISIIG